MSDIVEGARVKWVPTFGECKGAELRGQVTRVTPRGTLIVKFDNGDDAELLQGQVTVETTRNHLQQGTCPLCGSPSVEDTAEGITCPTEIEQVFWCPNCGTAWTVAFVPIPDDVKAKFIRQGPPE
jgi:hypothetical protein